MWGTGASSGGKGGGVAGGPTVFGKVVFVLGTLGLVGYHLTVGLLEMTPASVGTWFPVGVMGLGLSMVAYDRMTDVFEEDMPNYDT